MWSCVNSNYLRHLATCLWLRLWGTDGNDGQHEWTWQTLLLSLMVSLLPWHRCCFWYKCLFVLLEMMTIGISSSIFIAGTLILGVMNGHGNPSPTSLWHHSRYHYPLSLSLCKIKGQPLSCIFLWSMGNIMMWPVVIHQPSFRRTPVNIATQSRFWLFRWVTSLRTGSPWWEPLSHCDCQWLVTMMSVRSPSQFYNDMYVHPCVQIWLNMLYVYT